MSNSKIADAEAALLDILGLTADDLESMKKKDNEQTSKRKASGRRPSAGSLDDEPLYTTDDLPLKVNVSLANRQGSIFDKAIVLVLEFGRLGVTRQVSAYRVSVQADKSMLHLSKKLLVSPELDAIASHDGATRNYVACNALPSPLHDGSYLIPLGMVEGIEDYLLQRMMERADLIKQFRTTYDQRVRQALDRLGELANPKDYMSKDAACQSFFMTWKWINYGIPQSLQAVRKELFDKEAAKLQESMQEAEKEVRAVLRNQALALMEQATNALLGKKDGKPKKFYASNIENIEEFLRTFDAKDITDDLELKRITLEMRNLIKGVTPETVRSDESFRQQVGTQAAAITEKLSGMMDEVGEGRRIRFD